LKKRLKVERLGVLVLSVFYIVSGSAETLLLLSDFRLVHVGFLAASSFIIAYGLIKMKRWSVWLVTVFFFPALTFGATVLYPSVSTYSFYPNLERLFLHLTLILYIAFCFISLVYVAAKRKDFE